MKLLLLFILFFVYMSMSTLIMTIIKGQVAEGDDKCSALNMAFNSKNAAECIKDQHESVAQRNGEKLLRGLKGGIEATKNMNNASVNNDAITAKQVDEFNKDSMAIGRQFTLLSLLSQTFIYNIRSIIGKMMGSIMIIINLINSSQYTAQSIWNGPLGKAVEFVDGL